MIRILLFRNVNLGDLKPVLDGPEFLTTRIGDSIEIDGSLWELVEVLTSGLAA